MNNTNKTRNLILAVILMIAAGVVGYFIGKGMTAKNDASIYGVTAQQRARGVTGDVSGGPCKGGRGVTGDPCNTMANPAGPKITVAPGFYYRSTNGGQGCIITAESTEVSFTIDLPCPFNAPSGPTATNKIN